jgi:hypothetical protein
MEGRWLPIQTQGIVYPYAPCIRIGTRLVGSRSPAGERGTEDASRARVSPPRAGAAVRASGGLGSQEGDTGIHCTFRVPGEGGEPSWVSPTGILVRGIGLGDIPECSSCCASKIRRANSVSVASVRPLACFLMAKRRYGGRGRNYIACGYLGVIIEKFTGE